MDREKREAIAAFRFGVIYPLLDIEKGERGRKEEVLREISEKRWNIPYSKRSYISRATVLLWLKKYEQSGKKIESLHPAARSDNGGCRIMEPESELAFINLRKQFPKVSMPVFVGLAKERGVLPPDFDASLQSLYRIVKRHGLGKSARGREDRRKFEVEMPGDLWQSDALHGPRVIHEGRLRKSYMFAILDDHSRLITHAEFYLQENTRCFLDCFKKALRKRGIPRKLYVDNGAAFRSHKLTYGCAALGIALSYAKPYRPQGKGKIERFNRTIRTQLLQTLPAELTLEQLNRRLSTYLEETYQTRAHSSTAETPLDRYLKGVHMLRAAPENLSDYFRSPQQRRVGEDRTVRVAGRLYEAPVGLIGKKVKLLLDEDEPSRIEVFDGNQSAGFLTPLNMQVNSRVARKRSEEKPNPPEGGALFDRGGRS
ncbi:MAG: DDE-type integrase/transposase/recombinase [Spirochaetales bacterium]|nr:DDE-type integrase/transposase/recombinase [Spirochaetales bacterium]